MLKVEAVGFSYGQNLILNQITFDVMPGEIVGIVGISGSGKSTLGRLILQEMAPNQGRIASTYESVLPIFQHATYAFNPKLTIQASLNEAAQYQQQTEKEIKAYRDELMSQMELPKHLLSHYPSDVSGGQLQRFNVIRTLMLKPDLLICDEVTANLDVVAEAKMAHQLKRYAEEAGKTMIIISHDIAFLQGIVNRIIVLHEGQLVDDFPISRLFETSRHPATQDLLQIYTDMM
ncbi:peptide ABC transporter ATP-binding protein [Staphylococcus felis]|uniref:ABC transporter ATP-binding protein n=1 Tax=Staphylococcus felis TaxID=46127 RepID=UPI000E232F80|nr:ATP-binding cassette domain-containing protein [Staphylococcus felis]REH98375.1 peptide ABC transporter ATP-binding protein [Staphylococcus felis]REI04802.1 peptide ABC transporter ATP-binding protein [Staphylococcus felis]REI24730.1 peptide ABC transporter ATP-binding protein [Staphylococcus felis]REI33466.1 peptide ABC transporter ATP-binding protein [Staphylococcus felis]